jgi:uncharacterized protein
MAQTKKQIVEAINKSFSEKNIEGFLDHCADDITWTMVGETSKTGKTVIREWLGLEDCEPPVFSITHLVEESDVVVCNGDMAMKDKEGNSSRYSFCDIYRFNGDKVAELTTFIVSTDAKESTASA